jgi:hypothetical protein
MSAPSTDLGRATADLIDAFNGADWDRMRSHLAADVAYSETGTGRDARHQIDVLALLQQIGALPG